MNGAKASSFKMADVWCIPSINNTFPSSPPPAPRPAASPHSSCLEYYCISPHGGGGAAPGAAGKRC
ncbi:hypothetical protein E2C01_010126 [Portunus trituberculatus]|uniref:Uncharacterized protein n=1 Tax=Portunus trituberculatus TaxID=210409 RepID=A0A5B7D7T2_PORTR|nr:hypothetical protein [Portunus trituberculatus]